MRKFLTLLAILISLQAAFGDVRTIMVDGYCYLEDQSQHSETKVKFIKVSPSAVTDSAYTDSSGYFILSGLYEGIYDVEYSHAGFDAIRVEDQVLVSGTTLPPVSMPFTHISGSLRGILGPGTFRITGDISVNSGDSLRLLPGTTFRFEGPYSFGIDGRLLAEGIESDSIVFTTNPEANPSRWRGLRFLGSGSSGSRLGYCIIRYAYGTEYSGSGRGGDCESSSPIFAHCTISDNLTYYGSGGGLYCGSSSPTFEYCTLQSNSAYYSGGGVYCASSSPTFMQCTVRDNSAWYGSGGGVYCVSSSPIFSQCQINGNSHDGVYCESSSPVFTHCELNDNSGGAVYSSGSSPTFTYCTLSQNSGGAGGALYSWYSSPTFTCCSLSANTVNGDGGAVCSHDDPSLIFTYCTIAGNSATGNGGGVYCASSSLMLTNCTLSGNSANSNGGGIGCYNASSLTVTSSTISDNSAQYNGGGANCEGSSPSFVNCTLTGNSVGYYGSAGGAVCCRNNSSPIFVQCTISNNSAPYGYAGGIYCGVSSMTFNSGIIAFSTGTGIVFYNSASSQISYCDIFGNSEGNIVFYNDDPSQGPPMIGVPLVTNTNYDSCDIYKNIFVDPMFADTATGDFHLTDFSHCIGAGDPADTVSTDYEGDPRPNPSWSFPDIGVDEHWSGSPVLHLVISMSSGNTVLHWTPFGAGPYSIYGATAPFVVGELLDTVSDATTWIDEETASRPSRYFYYVALETFREASHSKKSRAH